MRRHTLALLLALVACSGDDQAPADTCASACAGAPGAAGSPSSQQPAGMSASSQQPAGSAGAPPSCGDGVVTNGEACDDADANGKPGRCKKDCSGIPAKVSISGDLFVFMAEANGKRTAGATITVLERPDLSAITDDQAHFEIDGLDEGSEATLVVDHDSLFPTQTATFTLGPQGIHPFGIQALPRNLYKLLSALLPPIDLDKNCAVAATVTRLGGTVHVMVRQGEAGATVALTPQGEGKPALSPDLGPIYFNEDVIPDKKMTATTKDGGVVFANIPPGDYLMTAQKPGLRFEPVKMKCRPGYLVNAGPPLGLQASVASPDWGADLPQASTAASALEALCDKHAACVNEKHPGYYPDATALSCKQTFRRVASFVDPTCDASSGLMAAWSAYATCKTGSCDLALGGDDACSAESDAWVASLDAYGACFSAR